MKNLLIATGLIFAMAACVSPKDDGATSSSQSVEPALQEANGGDLRNQLLEYRKPSEICQSDSPACKAWMGEALRCETNLANGMAGNACSKAEEYREAVTGIELSTATGAFKF